MDLQKLKKHRNHLIEYLKNKIEHEDWHAVSDAANDIRVIEARIEMLEMQE